MKAYLALGKYGDIISILPILHHEWCETRERQTLIISQRYSDLFRNVKYVNPVIFPGDWQDLAGGMRFAKRQFPEVVPCGTFGLDFPIQKRHPSFQYDQWERAGYLHLWDKIPTVVLRHQKPDKVKAAIVGRGPMIVVGDKGQSSPFPQADDLIKVLTEAFGDRYKIVRLSQVKLDHVADLSAMYERAACVVATEGIHLHLAKAGNTPIVAIATDSPSRWHGSAWSSQFLLHVRYSAYEQRKQEILDAIGSVLVEGVAQPVHYHQPDPILPRAITYAPQFAYNPSIMRVEDKLWTTWRLHPVQGEWRTELFLHDGEAALPLKISGYEQHSLEDARLFMFRGKPHVSLTISRSPLPGQAFSPCVTAYGELVSGADAWTVKELLLPEYGKNRWDGSEKNWLFWDFEKRLMISYGISNSEHVVFECDGVRQMKTFRSPCAVWKYGVPRGGSSPLKYSNGNLIRFFHSNDINRNSDEWWTYRLGAMVLESAPPFRILKMSSKPIYTGNEKYWPGHKHWKARVVFPCGAVETQTGWAVSCGLNDSQCVTLHLTEEHLNL